MRIQPQDIKQIVVLATTKELGAKRLNGNSVIRTTNLTVKLHMGQQVISAASCLIQSPFKRNMPQSSEVEAQEVNEAQPALNIKSRLRQRPSLKEKAGIYFPVSRIDRQLQKYGCKVSKNSSVYLAAVLQDLTETVLTQASSAVHKRKRSLIKPCDLVEAFKSVPELKEILEIGIRAEIEEADLQ